MDPCLQAKIAVANRASSSAIPAQSLPTTPSRAAMRAATAVYAVLACNGGKRPTINQIAALIES